MELGIVGAGVIGLSTGIRLLEAGYGVRIYAKALPPATTSDVAAAVWYPYRAEPREKVARWGRIAFDVFRELTAVAESGVAMITGCEFFGEPVADPWWRDLVEGFRRAAPQELPAGYRDGYVFTVPGIDTSLYMPYLLARFRSGGGIVEQRTVEGLGDLLAVHRGVIQCAGLGARDLVGDRTLYPVRGQVVRVRRVDLPGFLLDQSGPHGLAYVVPRRDDCLLGGTAEEGDERLEPDPATAEEILRKCAALAPALRDAEVLGHAVGLRPCRPEIRLEAEPGSEDSLIVHNYGHGGAGVTLSWGCAAEVVGIVEQWLAGGARCPGGRRRPQPRGGA
jgi:D-amino-acid oxidase